MSVEMLMEGHYDSGDFFAGVVFGPVLAGYVLWSEALRFHLVGAVDAFTDFAYKLEAEAEEQQG